MVQTKEGKHKKFKKIKILRLFYFYDKQNAHLKK